MVKKDIESKKSEILEENAIAKEIKKNNGFKRLPITNDYIFKRIFAYEGNESILKDLLEAILKINIQKIQIKNPEIVPFTKDEKR